MNKKVIIGALVILLACCGVYASLTGLTTGPGNDEISAPNVDLSSLEIKENLVTSESLTTEKKWYTTDKSDTNTILVENNSTLNITDSAVNKTGDSSSNGDNVDFYGTNSAILVKKGSVANIEKTVINTSSKGSNAVFVTNSEQNSEQTTNEPGNMQSMSPNMQQPPENEGLGGMSGQSSGEPPSMPPEGDGGNNNPGMSNEDYSSGGATANVKDVEINTYNDKSRGLDATYGGKINAENVIINTRGGSCAALATDRGEGTVTANRCIVNTGVDNGTGRGSPCIYSTGNITVTNSKGTAYNSQIACIEGKNSITLNDCDLNCFGGGNREENGKFVDLGGFFIYQSMSGDANIGTATLNVTNSKLSINESSEHYSTAPMFHVTNTKAIINIKNSECNFGSGTLLNVSGQNQWGTAGSNGGDLEFNMNSESLKGNITIDKISSLSLNMVDSDYTGSINPSDDYGNTTVKLDDKSSWTLTGDCHVSSLENHGNIEYGSYTLYVNGEAYTASNPYK